jgi:titin
VVEGNDIGTNVGGEAAVPNGGDGVDLIAGASGNTIGGSLVNVISGNAGAGVLITDAGTSNNVVAGNYIGIDSTGQLAVGNSANGVAVLNGATNNTIGTTTAASNVISGNALNGIVIGGSGTTGIVVEGNYVGTNVGGTAHVPNGGNGVVIKQQATGNTIGSAAGGSLIAGNTGAGVVITDSGTTGNVVQGNTIVSNSGDGVLLAASGNTIGKPLGGSALAGNTIQSNGGYGVNNQGTQNPVLSDSIVGNTLGGIHNSTFVEPAPSLTSVFVATNLTIINGSITGSPVRNGTLTLEFFTSPSGNQGQTLFYETTVTTDGLGNASFSFRLNFAINRGQLVTATSTDPNGNTSQFSNALVVTGTGTPSVLPSSQPAGSASVTQAGPVGGFVAGAGHLAPPAVRSYPFGTKRQGKTPVVAVKGVARSQKPTAGSLVTGRSLGASNRRPGEVGAGQ